MNQEESNKKIQELEKKVEELSQYIAQRKTHQIDYPLDTASIRTIAEGLQQNGYVIT